MDSTARLIVEECRKHTGTDPVEIFNAVAGKDFVRMHGPEHHVLDGACLLVAYRNAGETLTLKRAWNG